MQVIISLIIGYLMGCISPAAIISKIKNVNLKETGTRNLGATNTTLVLGKRAGVVVLVVDIMKSILSAKLVKLLFPHAVCAGMIACIGCILGHCFPVFLGFQGGKGLAAFAGMVLEYNPWFAIPIVIPGVILALRSYRYNKTRARGWLKAMSRNSRAFRQNTSNHRETERFP